MADQMKAGKTVGADQISDAAKAINIDQEPEQSGPKKPKYNINTLSLYFGDPYPITDDIVVRQPYIQDILDYGENEFYSMLYMFIGNTTFRKVFLWNNGIDWNKTSDYELFCNLVKMLSVEDTKVLFGDIDFSGFNLYAIEDADMEPEPDPNKKLTLNEKMWRKFREFERTRTFYNPDSDIEINAETYHFMVAVLREMFLTFPKSEYTHSKVTKELLIKEEHDKLKKAEREAGDSQQSTLLPLISFCVNHPGFKYRKDELRKVQIYEFMDSVRRLQVYESTRALMTGSYSGFCDTSKIPKSQFDFMRPINQS